MGVFLVLGVSTVAAMAMAAAASVATPTILPQKVGSPPHAISHQPVPEFEINLDLAPEERFAKLVPHFNATVWAFWNDYFAKDPILRDALYLLQGRRGKERDEEQQGEIEGMAKMSGLPLQFVQGVQLIYELQTVMVPIVNFTVHSASTGSASGSADAALTRLSKAALAGWDDDSIPAEYRVLQERLPWHGLGCTGIIARDKSNVVADGDDHSTVWHARNLDFGPVSVFKNLVYSAIFTKNGKEVFRSQQIAGYSMVVTAARWDTDNGYAIERNTRYTDHYGGNKEMFTNIESGRPLNGWSLRKILETVPDYETAVEKIGEAQFVSTEYSIVSGVGKGTILAKDPEGVAHVQILAASSAAEAAVSATVQKDSDFILITNFDYYWHDVREYFDPTAGGGFLIHPTRRQAAQKLLQKALASSASTITPDDLWNTINAEYVLADTVFQALINVEKRIWNISQPLLASPLATAAAAQSQGSESDTSPSGLSTFIYT